jgi:hypothetical protein
MTLGRDVRAEHGMQVLVRVHSCYRYPPQETPDELSLAYEARTALLRSGRRFRAPLHAHPTRALSILHTVPRSNDG